MNFEYKPGARLADAQKLKPFYDDEFEIIDIIHGKGKFTNAAIFVMITKDGDIFKGILKGTLEEKEKIYANRKKY